jgi:RNA-directed DNA polymerase
MTLDGLEETVKRAVPRRSRVNFIRYADDFIITGKSQQLLEKHVKPAVEAFLAERGLTLSPEKTTISYIRDGFTFLGQTFRKHGRVLHITPAKQGVLALIQKVGTLIRTHVSAPMPSLTKKLNQTLRGWANYHRHVVASEAFRLVEHYVFKELWRMVRRRHQNKSMKWLTTKYWSAAGLKHVFSVFHKTAKGQKKLYQVLKLSSIAIRRHRKITAEANPYLPEWAGYFWTRRHKKESTLLAGMTARETRALSAAYQGG